MIHGTLSDIVKFLIEEFSTVTSSRFIIAFPHMIRAKDVWIIFKKVFCVISINKRDDCYNLLLIWIRLALTRDFLQEKSMIRSLVTFIEGIPRNKGNIVKLTLLSQAKDRLPFRTMLSSNSLRLDLYKKFS